MADFIIVSSFAPVPDPNMATGVRRDAKEAPHNMKKRQKCKRHSFAPIFNVLLLRLQHLSAMMRFNSFDTHITSLKILRAISYHKTNCYRTFQLQSPTIMQNTQAIHVSRLGGIDAAYRMSVPRPYDSSSPIVVLVRSFTTSSELRRSQHQNGGLLAKMHILAIELLGHGQT